MAELTLRNRRGYILMAATALVQTGVPISQITSLDVIVNIDHAKALLKFLYNLAGDKTNNQIYHIATLLKTISRHHLHQSEETVDQLRRLCKKLKPEGEGFTEKNRRCLRQFADLTKLASLLRLASLHRWFGDVRSGAATRCGSRSPLPSESCSTYQCAPTISPACVSISTCSSLAIAPFL